MVLRAVIVPINSPQSFPLWVCHECCLSISRTKEGRKLGVGVEGEESSLWDAHHSKEVVKGLPAPFPPV